MSESFGLRACAARIELTIPGALTLKDRRAVVKSLIERLKGRFNLSACDLDSGERGAARAAIGIAIVSNSPSLAREAVQKAIEFITSDGRAEVGDTDIMEM